MEAIKKTVEAVKSNPVAALIGAGVMFAAYKKFALPQKTWQLATVTVIGVFAGAMIGEKYKSLKARKENFIATPVTKK